MIPPPSPVLSVPVPVPVPAVCPVVVSVSVVFAVAEGGVLPFPGLSSSSLPVGLGALSLLTTTAAFVVSA